jgi:lipoyl(octanoyl) transferase
VTNFLEFRSEFAYDKALAYQGFLNQSGHVGVLGFECPPTITLGRAAVLQDEVLVSQEFLQERKVTLLATDRGGKATWHGPGQLVCFPVANLRELYGDAKAVKRFTEELLITLAHACAALGVKSVETRLESQPGLWTNKGKLASIGLTVKEGYLFHGFSINVKAESTLGFNLINPCGISNCPMTFLEQEGVKEISLEQVLLRIAPYLNSIFKRAGADLSKVVNQEAAYSDLVSAVTRSQMAMEHMGQSYDGVRLEE